MALSNTATAQLQQHIEEVSRTWVQEYIRNRVAVLSKRKISATGELATSMQYTLTNAVQGAVVAMLDLSFQDQMRWLDMKNLNVPAGGLSYIDDLAAWVVRKGLSSKFIADYVSKRRLRKPPQNVLNQIAWGIARKRSIAYKRRPVAYSKSKSAAITDLFNQVAAGLPEIVAQEIKAGFFTS